MHGDSLANWIASLTAPTRDTEHVTTCTETERNYFAYWGRYRHVFCTQRKTPDGRLAEPRHCAFDTDSRQNSGNCDPVHAEVLSMRLNEPQPSAIPETPNSLRHPIAQGTQSCAGPTSQSLDGSMINLIRGSGGVGTACCEDRSRCSRHGRSSSIKPVRSTPSVSAPNLSSFVQPFSRSERNPAGLPCVW
jgi:hypothetical protein